MRSTIRPVALCFRISLVRPSGMTSRLIRRCSASNSAAEPRPCSVPARAPLQRLDRLPALGAHGAVAGVHDRVHHVAVVESLLRLPTGVQRVQHAAEHVRVAQLGHLVAHGEQPAAVPLGLLGHVASLPDVGKHLETGAQPVVDPDRAFAARHLVAQVHAPAEAPAHLELPDGPVLVAHQADGAVLHLDRVDLGVGPAHDLHGPHPLAHEGPPDLDAVAAHVHDGAAPGGFRVPEPGAVRPGVGLAGAGPQHPAHRAGGHRLGRLQHLGVVDQVLQVAVEHPGLLHGLQHLARVPGIDGPEAWCTAPLCRPAPRPAPPPCAGSWAGPTTTTSVSGSSIALARSSVQRATPQEAAASRARSAEREYSSSTRSRLRFPCRACV